MKLRIQKQSVIFLGNPIGLHCGPMGFNVATQADLWNPQNVHQIISRSKKLRYNIRMEQKGTNCHELSSDFLKQSVEESNQPRGSSERLNSEITLNFLNDFGAIWQKVEIKYSKDLGIY